MKHLLFLLILTLMLAGLGAEAVKDAGGTEGAPAEAIPLRKITIYSSGVSYFEHGRTLEGPAVLKLPFKTAAVNDALKSLLLNDPASAAPRISYPSERSLGEMLQGLGIELSGNPDTAGILGSLRGEEVEILAPDPFRGRIIAVDRGGIEGEIRLSLFGPQGLRSFNLAEIGAVRFTRTGLNADLNRALDLIAASRNSETREITVSLPGTGSRPVSISYVIPAPVWKVSYRLDMGDGDSAAARFQGWAIVDNDSDEDWRDVELSLAAGRPVSFIQNLYPPYYLDRPTMPLAIAGSAAPVTWDSALVTTNQMKAYARAEAAPAAEPMPQRAGLASVPSPPPVTGADMADQFSFTLNSPVNLDRRTSAMFPLANGEIGARKFLLFSGVQTGRTIHPGVGAELNNNTELRLPAGPVTVYDGGSYAGDALLEFLNRGEKRFISWGEDLSVTGISNISTVRTVTAVTLSGGVMTISRRQGIERKYQFKNTGPEAKTIVIEHPVTPGAALVEPQNYDEAAAAYRFIRELPAGGEGAGEAELLVREEIPLSESVVLTSLRPETLISYSASQELPADVRAVLVKAVELRQNAEDAEKTRAQTEARKNTQAAEQDRIRRNLEAAGNGSPQGQEYLRRLTVLDEEIDRLNGDLERQR
ncbi:MAG: DUF4139 domain-containing protein, partial [Treponema sp.]|nr:DUF4139 domain-containing protein [Treponema sp.]